MKLYRVMSVDPADGKPLVGVRRNMLGVRPTDPTSKDPRRRPDVSAVVGSDLVLPGAAEGLSVSSIASGRIAGRNEAVWEIDEADLSLLLAPVPAGPPHFVLEPTVPMTLGQYQAALWLTRDLWVRLP